MKTLFYKILFIVMILVGVSSCTKYDFEGANKQRIKDNVENVFGVIFDPTHDWCTTTNYVVSVIPNSPDIDKVQILLTEFVDSAYSIRLLNEAKVESESMVTLSIDVPYTYNDLLVSFVKKNKSCVYKTIDIKSNEPIVYDTSKLRTRSVSKAVPSGDPVVTGTVATFANQRNWLPGEVFYITNCAYVSNGDYDESFKAVFCYIIFNYFPNGRKYNNLPKIKESGYYNENCYPITTGKEPIFVSPVYKNDGGYYEISAAELYYYYFKGDLSASEIEALPKYRAIDLSSIYSNSDNDRIGKGKSFVLAYFGDGTPKVGTTGSYQFPEGYKIGFCYKSNTTYEQPKKQGEVYGDGRLNYNINKWGNFKSSKLEDTDPRMAWMSVNEKMYLCIESGTDSDFNDLIIEVEGGIKPIIIIPDDTEYNFYTFLYEDHNLGDYDMNDVVLKGCRINETTVEYTLMACGASDNLYIYNIEGSKINSNTEVHDLFNKAKGQFVNTEKGDTTPYIVDQITVDRNFSFLDASQQPYIYDKSINNKVYLSTVGEDPHAIMIPYDFHWPLERVCIKDAYSAFNSWGMNKIISTDWYKFPNEAQVY